MLHPEFYESLAILLWIQNMIVIIDYGVGNLRSILTKFDRLKIQAVVSSDPQDIRRADKLVLPGVGHYQAGMINLRKSNLIPVIEERVFGDRIPLLGICLGMQLLLRKSEESPEPGLGWIDGQVKRFEFNRQDRVLRVPHMGWNDISIESSDPFIASLAADCRFYFAHSYYVPIDVNARVIASTWYGHDFVSVLQKENIWATQFHPEKSHLSGLQIIRNFADVSTS